MKKIALFAALCAVVLSVWLVHNASSTQREAPVVSEVPTLRGQHVEFSSDFATRIGLATEVAAERELSPIIEVTGQMDFDPRAVAIVGARVSGRVREVHKIEGDLVAKGELLVSIDSVELGRAQAEALKAHAHLVAAEAEEQREAELAEAKIASTRDAEAAHAVALAARAESSAADKTVHALGGEIDAAELGIVRLRSPIAGSVVSGKLVQGELVDAQAAGYRVANLSKLWLVLAVFEQDLESVREGDAVDVAVGAARFTGKVAHVGAVIAAATRSADVRIVVDNRSGALRPGQAVRARIHASAIRTPQIAVPSDAVARLDGRAIVFVRDGDTSVEVRNVELGRQGDERIAIASGLALGDEVVTKGVFALKSEVFR